MKPAILGAGPGAGVAIDAAAPCLGLDEPEAHLRQDEQIDFVDGPVAGLQLEVSPGSVRIVVGQSGADEVQTTPFPLVLRQRDDAPTWRFHAIPDSQLLIAQRLDNSSVSPSTCLSKASRSFRLNRR